MSWSFADSIEAFRALPSADQYFWHNLALVYTGYTDGDFGSAYYDTRTRQAINLFHSSCIYIEWEGLPGLGLLPYWTTAEPPYSLDPSPVDATIYYAPIYNQWIAIPATSLDYPRPQYKIRKSYWTGTPKRRRNL